MTDPMSLGDGILHLLTGPELASSPRVFGLTETEEPSGELIQARLFFDLSNRLPCVVQPTMTEETVRKIA